MTVIESAVQWAIAIANNNSHGYSQNSRWGPDYDCSSFVISAFQQAGVPLREHGANTTRDMRQACIACGFTDVSYSVGLTSGYGILAGDILLNESAHTCLAIGNGKVANCRTAEGHPQQGDQSGNEIRVQNFWSYPWNCCLRYKGKEQAVSPVSGSAEKPADEEDHNWKPSLIRSSNSYSTDCVVLQAMLNARHFACGSADGFFGPKTQAAVNKFQRWAGIEVDGVCGPLTWKKLMEMG